MQCNFRKILKKFGNKDKLKFQKIFYQTFVIISRIKVGKKKFSIPDWSTSETQS